ncbi:MAG: phosphopyruvate hydratase [Alphaproteobacteria bacterium]|nr:phosphopyruvate hydratase [Alphaproteobacteria bacterium]
MTPTSAIETVLARRVWDSRGRPTVEAEIVLASGAVGRAIAPAGASTGSGEALDRRDGGPRLKGRDVQGAIGAVREEIAPALKGLDARDQARVDETMIALDGTPQKSRLGGNALIAVSMAVAHAAAADARLPLWAYLHGDPKGEALLPVPEIQIFGGGAHAARALDLQDLMVVPAGAPALEEGFEWVAEVYDAAGELLAKTRPPMGVADEGGHWPAFESNEDALETLNWAIRTAALSPGRDMFVSVDVAATQLWHEGAYRLASEDRTLATEEFSALLAGWCEAYHILSLEDPFREDDAASFAALQARIGGRVQLIGDDYLVTDVARLKRAVRDKACGAILIKPNQAGTLTETKAALDAAKAAGFGTIVSARSGESEDVTIVHLAVGWGAGQLKVGSFTRSERMAKWNELLRVAEALGERGRWAPQEVFKRWR